MVTLDLPWPPTTNTLWRHRTRRNSKRPMVYLNPKYQRWRNEADKIIMAERPKGLQPVYGRFTAEIILDERRRRSNTDVGNREKAVMDCLQRMLVIEDDALADRIDIKWGKANGVRVTIAEAT